MNENFACIEQWELGIKTDPSYAGNYYYASRYYFFTTDKVWALIYGEIFINMESYSSKTAEMKSLLLDGYKKFFVNDPKVKPSKNKNEFTEQSLNRASDIVFKKQNYSQALTYYKPVGK